MGRGERCGRLAPMTTINRRIAASIEGDFVVFIIGARFNRWWKLPKYLWFLSTMPKMLAEVAAEPESGFLGWEPLGLTTNMQYWRSFEHLTAYSRNRDQTHYPYWVKFNKEIGSNGDIGIWHETFLVRAGEYKCIYNNMPLRGLAKASKHIDAIGPRTQRHGTTGPHGWQRRGGCRGMNQARWVARTASGRSRWPQARPSTPLLGSR